MSGETDRLIEAAILSPAVLSSQTDFSLQSSLLPLPQGAQIGRIAAAVQDQFEQLIMTKTKKVIYWISTVWLALGMTSTAIAQLIKMPDGVVAITRLGYPVYLLTILGVWKILGAVAVLIPRYPLLKEWAYAGFFFAMSGATISHLVLRDPVGEIFPSVLLLILTLVSWYFRPESRKPTS